VTNSGQRAGADVLQVYVRAADGAGIETWRLAGFARVELAPGASRRVEIELEPRTFARWDAARGGWHIEDRRYPVALGRSAADHVQHAQQDGAHISL
jgi:beta-glucosidase